ncbi:hypothetical protein PSHT_03948 [Puccinia striiformis]|uniref:Uncharacterized protein n=5 Tax=Puccinia striiformis TaxID=27350 RepID=A0A0L0VUI9_9BASI|nr:hypothetical protein PSTG_03897 [Puccinia striiformis f. sp. tritici PST-78]POW04450.1 hypothetical protein PSTT_10358 [Puccinia striiformis]POW20105.1 hypothetical protein PSHT_03948 [Puccinia striiformis]
MTIQAVLRPTQYKWWYPGFTNDRHMPDTARHMRGTEATEMYRHNPSIEASEGDAKAVIEWDHGYQSVTVESKGPLPMSYIIQDPVSKAFSRGDLHVGDKQTVAFLQDADPNHLLVWTRVWVP